MQQGERSAFVRAVFSRPEPGRGAAGRAAAAAASPGRSVARSPAAAAACAPVVNIVSGSGGFVKHRDCAESDTICSDIFLPAVRDEGSLPRFAGGRFLKKKKKLGENHGRLWGCVWCPGTETGAGENSVYFAVSPSLYLPPSHRQRGARGTASPAGISCQASRRESGCGDPGGTSAPRPAGKIAPQLFCFHQPGRAAEPGVRMPGCGAGVQLGSRDWGTAPLGGCARGNGKFVRSPASACRSRPKPPPPPPHPRPRTRHRAGAGSEAGLYPQPLGGPGVRGEADPAGGAGWARLPEPLPSSAGPRDGSWRALGQGFVSGLLELAALRRRASRDRPAERSRRTWASPAAGCWTC